MQAATNDARMEMHGDRTLSASTRGLLWREWLAHGETLLLLVSTYLIFGWALQIFFHPGFMLMFGVILALFAGSACGGSDASEGSEEFAFSLPPTRGERYIVRLAFGGLFVGTLTVVGLLSIALDLPQIAWSIFVSSGFTTPFPKAEPGFIYALALAIPSAAYAMTFAVAAAASTRGTVNASWLLGGLGAAAVMAVGFGAEWLLWFELNGYISTPLLLAATALAAQGGYFLYVRKEGVSRPAPMTARAGSAWLILVALVVVVVFLLMMFMVKSNSVSTKTVDTGPTRETQPAPRVETSVPAQSETE
jgi:hypothetical protein